MAPPPITSAATTSVQVALRIRPTTKQDATSIPTRFQRTVIHAISNQVVAVDPVSPAQTAGVSTPTAAASSTPGKKQTFAFDQVLDPETTQFDLYQATAAPLIPRFLEGFNCTILAYGQTSSGKTYSMTGVDLDADPTDPYNGMGIIPRSIYAIFSQAASLKEERAGAWTYSIKGSFIELYNEELIDLLSYDDVGGGRREVQIREDKHGHIIWDGLREIAVRNVNEVMNLIRQGTSIRRTNETDMNAQSSRSHAIFSLTLTQRKYSGSGAPARSSTPVTPGGRSPSRLARPVSHQFTAGGSSRVSSPTFGRPPTPSFATAMGRGGGLRPSSAMGSHTPDGKAKNVEDDSGEWVTVVSKFHFVDLAGSERLKRTSAAGERVKEGISINSGLLALGNVISALGDPSRAKSHTASHVPYRDSKLTRLLQDSLGGNAHTLMIACISPAEWNANETVNTLKYANRARNIKNRAVVTEKEEGWDDLEWLQNTVVRLRRDLKSLKEGGGIPSGEPVEVEGASKKVLTQMVDLQSNYEDLREKFVERTEELTRLRRELGERQRSSTAGAVSGTAKYEEIVGPVIEEYEKTISAMEAELSLNRAALRHTNDLVEEKEEELSQLQERHSATELYLEELKTRVGKLSEREASTEAYIRDLEDKIRQQEDTTISSSESVSDLKREIARIKDSEGRSAHYIAELEARLARSDESILDLRAQVEKLEQAAEAKQEEAKTLQTRLSSILTDGESWRSDLEEREKRVRDLEQKMEDWEAKKKAAGEDRVRIGEINKEVQQARRSLEVDMAEAAKSIKILHPDSSAAEVDVSEATSDASLQQQLETLRETHAATLADLSSVTSKYRDALKEISDLAGQIDEIKLGSPSSRSDSPERNTETPPPIMTRRRAATRVREIGETEVNGAGRKFFFRQAASAESLRSRSQSQSQSLSQELFSARSRMLSSPDTNHAGTFVNGHARGSPTGFRPNLSISLPIGPGRERSVSSLEKEIMRLQEVLKERETEITSLEATLKEKEKEVVLNGDSHGSRSSNASSLSPRMQNQFDAIRKSMEIRHPPSDLAVDNEPLDRLNELMLSMALKEAQHKENLEELNEELNQVKDELSKMQRAHDDLSKLSRDQTFNMSTELDALRGEHDQVLAELQGLRKKEDELLQERGLLEQRHREDISKLQQEHEQGLRDKQSEVDALLGDLKAKHEEALRGKQAEVDALLSGSASEHSKALAAKEAQLAAATANLKAEHKADVLSLQRQLADAAESLSKSQRAHEKAFGKLKDDHGEEIRKLKEDVQKTMAQVKEEHEATVVKLTSDHASALKEKEDTLNRTEEEYYTVLSKLRADHAEALAKLEAEGAAAIERLKEEHAGELKMAELTREGSLTESQSQQAELLQQLQSEYASAMEKKEAMFVEDLQKAKDEHAATMERKQLDHSASFERLKSKQASRLAELEESKNLEIEALQKSLAATHEQHESERSSLSKEKEDSIQELQRQHSEMLAEMARSHDEAYHRLEAEQQEALASVDASHKEDLEKLQQQHCDVLSELEKMHDVALTNLKSELAASQRMKGELEASSSQLVTLQEQAEASHQEVLDAVLKEKTEEILKLKAEHQQAILELENSRVAAMDQHRQDLENARAQSEVLLIQERERLAKALADAEAQFSAERETLRKDVELLQEDIASYKAVAEEYTSSQEDTRQAHSHALDEKEKVIASLRAASETAQIERLRYEAEIEELRRDLESSRADSQRLQEGAAQHGKIAAELDRHRTLLSDVQKDLQKTKEQKDSLLSERNKQDALIRDLQVQLVRSPVQEMLSPPLRPTPDRNTSFQRTNGMTKLPPLTPPPSVPPPPAPKSIPPLPSSVPMDVAPSSSSQSNTLRSSGSSREDPSSPATSTASTSGPSGDQALTARLEEQQRHLEEQEVMIKTLNKQLTHCESDLQVHMDLVGQLETSLGDSEKNLRKARMQATEISRERDALNIQIERLRKELEEARREVNVVRQSVVEEKQSLESRLDEERRAKERVRQQLDMRVEELQRRKSKFVCL